MATIAAATMMTTNDHAGSQAKKPYVRIMTDKRREQNRRAQKAYREKMKRKIEDLETQAATTNRVHEDQHSSESGSSSPVQEHMNGTSQAQAPKDPPSFVDFGNIFSAAGDLSVPNFAFGPAFDLPRDPTPAPSTKALTYRDEIPPGTDPLSLWQMPERSPGAAYSPPQSAPSSYMSGSLTAIAPAYAYERQKALIRQHQQQSRSRQTSPSLTNTDTSSSLALTLPSPHLNHLRLASESNLSASLAIGISIGISNTAYLEDHPSLFPRCTAKLFPTATLELLSGRGYPFAPKEFRDHITPMKSSLRPSAVQMFYSHPSYLDCIVFPRFREKAVQASVDGKLDHVEFFLDLMHGGLVCWGSSMPSATGRKKRRRGMQDQVAWSTRSWEARRWFLEKWAWLTGSEKEEEDEEDGEGIWKSSRWWWAVRGEVESEDEWSEDEQERVIEREGPLRKMMRFEVGVADAENANTWAADDKLVDGEQDRAWAEGRAGVKGLEEGASRFTTDGLIYPWVDPGSESI